MLAKLYYYIVVLVSVSLLGSQVLADDEPQDKRLFNSSSYKKVYSESSSLFWNNRFNDGQGLISLNLAEIIMFEAFDVTKNPETQGSEVLDIFSGLKFGGVLHEGFLLTFEVNVSNHQVKKKDAKKYNNFRLGMSFETGLLYGISLSQN